MRLDEATKIVAALNAAKERGVELPNHEYFEGQHDIIYIPWDEKIGELAEALEAAGCHWDEEADCWAHF